MKLGIPFLALCASVFAPVAKGDQCGTGWTLDLPPTAPIGSTVDADLTGPANEMAFLMVSGTTGSLPSQYGNVCVGFPILFGIIIDLDANGVGQVSGDIPCDPSLVGVTVYLQFITCSPHKGSSNLSSLTITDAICSTGDMVTFTQGGWGASCHGGNAGCRRDHSFDSVFPNGLTIGDQDGVDGDSFYALHFTSSSAVENFLPAKGTTGELKKDATDPTKSDAGVFAGQLLAAHLNVGFDDAGAFDDVKTRPDVKLGDLVFVGGVDSDLLGWSVRDVVDLCDQAISGELGAGPFDLDGDGNADVTIDDLETALDVLNENYDDGTSDNGNLALS